MFSRVRAVDHVDATTLLTMAVLLCSIHGEGDGAVVIPGVAVSQPPRIISNHYYKGIFIIGLSFSVIAIESESLYLSGD